MISGLVMSWGSAGDVVAGALVIAHVAQGDGVKGVVGGAVTASAESVTAGSTGVGGDGAAPQRWARADSLRSRWGLSPAVVSSCPAASGPTPKTALVRVRLW
jgi:hypothetical protein